MTRAMELSPIGTRLRLGDDIEIVHTRYDVAALAVTKPVNDL